MPTEGIQQTDNISPPPAARFFFNISKCGSISRVCLFPFFVSITPSLVGGASRRAQFICVFSFRSTVDDISLVGRFYSRRLSENPNDITLVSCIFPSARCTFLRFPFCIRLHEPSACIHPLTLPRTSSLRFCAAVSLASPSPPAFIYLCILSFCHFRFTLFSRLHSDRRRVCC